jgi:phospholipid/cholesterol/gamma-HCH transport system permease protein
MREILKTISKTLNEMLYTIGLYVIMTVESVVLLVFNPPSWGLIRDQLYNIGLLSLPVVAITGLSTGMVLAAQSFFQLADKGLASATGIMVGKAMMTELGPVLTAFMVTGRIGSAMCAEIGTMKVTEQLDAMRSMSVDPLSYLVSPRIIASTVMMPLLTLFSTLTGMLGGFIIASYFFDMAPVSYFGGMQIYITYFDFATGLVKAVVFGIFIGSICCFKGLNANGGAAGVGKATTNSVVIAYTCILIFNFLLTLGMNTVRVWIYHR